MAQQHNAAAETVIAAEITRCILGGAERPELRVDLTGMLARFVQAVARDLVPALQRFDDLISQAGHRAADEAERYANEARP